LDLIDERNAARRLEREAAEREAAQQEAQSPDYDGLD